LIAAARAVGWETPLPAFAAGRVASLQPRLSASGARRVACL